MKVTGLILVTLGLVAIAQASKHYTLRCTQEEMGIRWPSYESHSEYFVCPRIGGKQMTVYCRPGEVFTFVLQMCTSPSQYIPAPAMELLPTATPLSGMPGHHGHNNPIAHPPIMIEDKPPVFGIPPMKPQQPPVWVIEDPKPAVELVEGNKHEGEAIVKPSIPVNLPIVPMPPTPAPTPPMVEPVASGKKPLGKKPTADKKKPSAAKPLKPDSKKPLAEKAEKKSPKSPKRPAPAKTASAKAPKSPATAKKSPPKAPTKA